MQESSWLLAMSFEQEKIRDVEEEMRKYKNDSGNKNTRNNQSNKLNKVKIVPVPTNSCVQTK